MEQDEGQGPTLKRVTLRFKDSSNPPIRFESTGKVGQKLLYDNEGKKIQWKIYADDKTVIVPFENVLAVELDLNVSQPAV